MFCINIIVNFYYDLINLSFLMLFEEEGIDEDILLNLSELMIKELIPRISDRVRFIGCLTNLKIQLKNRPVVS
jgi:hypothetical protein